ncbi:MAG: HEPN domain-containing protein, partial [Methanosarcinales archaeon]
HNDYDTCVGRCYYSMFHAAIVALESVGIYQEKWSHTGVRNTFGKEIVVDRRMFPANIASYMKEVYDLRILGDYGIDVVDQEQANDALNMCNEFILKIKEVFNE